MNDFFQRLSPQAPPPQSQLLDPNQGLRMSRAPPLLPNNGGGGRKKKSPPPPILGDAPLRLHLPHGRRRDSVDHRRRLAEEEDLTVANLRRLYSSLLEEMAPRHHEMGTTTPPPPGGSGGGGDNYRWKNSGTVTVDGTDDQGYDYSYAPDDSRRSWRLQRNLPGVAGGGGGGGGGGGAGVTGGDWSKDGIRRYYTGGAIERGAGRLRTSKVISVGGIDVDVGTMNGVELSPKKRASGGRVAGDGEFELDLKFSIEDDYDGGEAELRNDRLDDIAEVGEDIKKQDSSDVDVAVSGSGSSLEDIALESRDGRFVFESSPDNDEIPTPSHSEPIRSEFDKAGGTSGDAAAGPFDNKPNMTTFESLYHLSPTMAWRLRSAYAPQTPQEEHLISLGAELLAQRHPSKADRIMKGLDVASSCESRVCDLLRRIGELISHCERLKGVNFAATEEDVPSEDENEDDSMEAAEALFAYFCEKNILPMLIDSLLCHPPQLTSSQKDGVMSEHAISPPTTTTIGSSPSPFSGVAWTPTVKAQILQTIAMILFNTSSPLSLTYLLSNNYMNELIMGIMPLSQWKDDAFEELLPPYITLLRGLAMRLRGKEGKCCLPLFLCQRQIHDNATETYLPLLYAAVNVFCSPFGTSLRDSEGSLIRTTAMNVILNLCRITDGEVRSVLVQGVAGHNGSLPITKSAPSKVPSPSLLSRHLTIEQELLFAHICNSLNSWFHRAVRLAMASLSINGDKTKHVEAKAEAMARHKDVAEMQFRELQYWLGFLDDLLSCEIRVWNARLVEFFLRNVVVGTVLLGWNRALEVIQRKDNEETKASSEMHKARAETRVSVIFFTQLFGMVEYSPLIRLVGALVLHHEYPQSWCGNLALNGVVEGFTVTKTVNSMICKIAEREFTGNRRGEAADAGAGGESDALRDLMGRYQEPSRNGENEVREKMTAPGDITEMERPLPGISNQLAKDAEHEYSNQLIPSPHRASLLKMLERDKSEYLNADTIRASMLLATILENDAFDDQALEIFGVLPSTKEEGNSLSPFETSIAQYLSQDWAEDEHSYAALESVSSLGLMLLERLVAHVWTEGGQCLDVVPFDHYYKSSMFIRALSTSLSQFASLAQSHVHEVSTTHEIFSGLIRERFSSADDADPVSPLTNSSNEGSGKMVCILQRYYPSNFIDNAGVLTCDLVQDCAYNDSSSAGDLILLSNENEAIKFALQSVLHLRSLHGCIQNFYSRFTSSSLPKRHWHGEGDLLTFYTTEEADDLLLSIGSIQMVRMPVMGAEIDLRGRKYFGCSLPRKSKFSRSHVEIVINANNGETVVVKERDDLVLVVDPLEIYVAKAKREVPNRCTILSVVPLGKVIASAPEGELLHIVVSNSKEEQSGQQNYDFVKNGTLTLRFDRSETSTIVKECMDKHCSAFEQKILMDMTDLLERCMLGGADNMTALSEDMKDAGCDFQQAGSSSENMMYLNASI